jgi:site-specific DNA-methyltransferase (adenine-specific)
MCVSHMIRYNSPSNLIISAMPFTDDTLFMPAIPDGASVTDPVIPWQRWSEAGGMSFTGKSLNSRDHLVLANNLDLLNILPASSVDLVYIDPPFATGKRRESPRGVDGPRGYEDNWDTPQDFVDWLSKRLTGLWNILTDNGNLVIHLDINAVHHVRIWCDREFGANRLENEIIWHYTGGGRSRKKFSRKHDVLLWYSKGPGRIFNIDAVREPYEPTSGYAKGGIVSKKGKKYMPHPEGKPVDDVWDIPIVNPMSSERTAYPTQKPLKLLERIVSALSDENSIVCDIFSGSGTTAIASRSLGRKYLCCDNNPDAIGVTLQRLGQAFPDDEPPAVLSHGFYRIPFAAEEYTKTTGIRFIREGNISAGQENCGIVLPSWRKDEDPPYPLCRDDLIVAP